MKIGIIGAGQIGSTLARKFIQAGHTIKLANSRGPASLASIASEIGATAASVTDAVKDVEVVIVSVPEPKVAQLPKGLFDGVPENVVIVDTGNYYPGFRNERIEEIEHGMPESRWVAQQLGRPVVKAFNSIMAYSLANEGRPSGSAERIALPVSGDDVQAKMIVIGLVEEAGFDGIDAGSLDESWRQQPGTPVYCTDYDIDGVRRALSNADKARAPELRDAGMAKLAQLPEGTTPKDLVSLVRLIK